MLPEEYKGVKAVLGRLLDVDGIEAALVASADGLMIDGAGRGADLDAVAAVGTYAIQAVRRMSELGDRGTPTRVTIEGASDLVILECLSDDAVLMLLLNDRVNLGYLRFLLDRYRESLQVAVSASES